MAMTLVSRLDDALCLVRDHAQERAWPEKLHPKEQLPMSRYGRKRLRDVIQDAHYTWCAAQVAILSPTGNVQMCSDCIELLDTNEDASWNWGKPDHVKSTCRMCSCIDKTWAVDIDQMDEQVQKMFRYE